jgi:pyridoxal phosphate enzyme (YggS family)
VTPVAPGLAERLSAVREGIADASRAAGRGADEITLVVVTKFHPASLVRDLHALGVREFGENRHQEAQAKATELADLDLRWNFVGQLQTKKARQVRRYASIIHSVDRDALVDALASEDDAALDVFLQINLTDDPARGGAAPADAPRLAERVLAAPGLELRGVMAVAPLGAEPRAAFAAVRRVSEAVRGVSPVASALSIGMSGDYREAIAEGATHLRIGTAITGNRQPLV